MKKNGYLLLVGLLLGTTAEAQFLKKLGAKIADKVEKTATDNLSDKAANETNETLNEAWGGDWSQKNKETSIAENSSSGIPESYDFDWKYTLRLDSNKKDIDLVYRLKKGANYMGIGGGMMGNIFMVMDFDRNLSVMFMNGFVRGTKMNTSEDSENLNPEMENFTFEKIASKTILGYDCDGYRAENNEYEMTMYVTDEVGVGFTGGFKNQEYLPKNFNPEWINENSLMMEMQMINKKNPKQNMTLICTGIEPENYTISK